MRSCRSRATIALTAGLLSLGLAACGGGDGEQASTIPPSEADVQVTGTDALKFEPTELQAAAGEVAVALTSEEAVEHNFVVEEVGDTVVVEGGPGTTRVGTIELEPGTYTYYCNIPGHRNAGMEGTLTVE